MQTFLNFRHQINERSPVMEKVMRADPYRSLLGSVIRMVKGNSVKEVGPLTKFIVGAPSNVLSL